MSFVEPGTSGINKISGSPPIVTTGGKTYTETGTTTAKKKNKGGKTSNPGPERSLQFGGCEAYGRA